MTEKKKEGEVDQKELPINLKWNWSLRENSHK